MKNINVAWWNLENLFDSDAAARPPALAKELAGELKGWTAAVRDRKLDQLALVIKKTFGGAGPDLLGVAEAESEAVLQLLADRLTLPNRKYKVLNHPSKDARGIDVSFIYDSNTLGFSNPDYFFVAMRRATRDLFWATFQVKGSSSVFVALANHWPSRTEGQYESEPFRMMVAENACYAIEQLFAQGPAGDKLPVLLMGDFNDEPFDRALEQYLGSTHDQDRVLRGRSVYLLNLMWPLLIQDNPGSYFYDAWNMFDQFVATKGLLLKDSPVRVDPASVAVFRPAEMCQKNGAPKRFGRPSQKNGYDSNGYSDHFPVTLTLQAK